VEIDVHDHVYGGEVMRGICGGTTKRKGKVPHTLSAKTDNSRNNILGIKLSVSGGGTICTALASHCLHNGTFIENAA